MKFISLLKRSIFHRSIKLDLDKLEFFTNLRLPNGVEFKHLVIRLFAYYSQWVSHYSDKIKPRVSTRELRLPDEKGNAVQSIERRTITIAILTVGPKSFFIFGADS